LGSLRDFLGRINEETEPLRWAAEQTGELFNSVVALKREVSRAKVNKFALEQEETPQEEIQAASSLVRAAVSRYEAKLREALSAAMLHFPERLTNEPYKSLCESTLLQPERTLESYMNRTLIESGVHQVWKATRDGKEYVLKQFPNDKQARMQREIRMLQHL
jgi:hypothetical protein